MLNSRRKGLAGDRITVGDSVIGIARFNGGQVGTVTALEGNGRVSLRWSDDYETYQFSRI
jgi:hypothetical protein